MFIVDVTLKNTPGSLSVQRKEAKDAEAVYQHVLDAIRSGDPKILELSCERQPDKKVGILSSEISAVQVSQKDSAATASGRPPGFVALAQ